MPARHDTYRQKKFFTRRNQSRGRDVAHAPNASLLYCARKQSSRSVAVVIRHPSRSNATRVASRASRAREHLPRARLLHHPWSSYERWFDRGWRSSSTPPSRWSSWRGVRSCVARAWRTGVGGVSACVTVRTRRATTTGGGRWIVIGHSAHPIPTRRRRPPSSSIRASSRVRDDKNVATHVGAGKEIAMYFYTFLGHSA